MNPSGNLSLLMEQVYQDAYCQISIRQNGCCIYQYYHRLPLSKGALQPALEMVLSLAGGWSGSGAAVFYLVEVADGKLLPSEDVTWFKKDAIPQLADAGIRYIAYVSENNLFRHFSQGNLMGSESGKVLNMRIFQEREDALRWLEEIQTTP